MKREIDRQIGAASAVMLTLYQSAVVKRELIPELSVYGLSYILTLAQALGTERMRLGIKAEMSFH